MNIGFMTERERDLAARHREIDVGQDLRVEQRPVQIAARVIDLVAATERVETIALPGMSLTRQRQGIDNGAQILNTRSIWAPLTELMIQESNVESGVVDDQLRTAEIRDELLSDVSEARLVGEKVI